MKFPAKSVQQSVFTVRKTQSKNCVNATKPQRRPLLSKMKRDEVTFTFTGSMMLFCLFVFLKKNRNCTTKTSLVYAVKHVERKRHGSRLLGSSGPRHLAEATNSKMEHEI